MGRTSQESKEVSETNAEYPVENKDYHVQRYKYGEAIRPGYYFTVVKKRNVYANIKSYVGREASGNIRLCAYTVVYAAYPGPKPDKKWGPVCP